MKTLRGDYSCIPPKPGVYKWWFPKEEAVKLLCPLKLPKQLIDQIQKENIEGGEYWCLYFGIAKDLIERAKWHIAMHHSPSSVKSGYLSTLRQTLSALLGMDMSISEHAVNALLDKCYWEWCPTGSRPAAEKEETEQLGNNDVFYPLNLQKNKKLSDEPRKTLLRLRKEHRK